MNHTTTPSYKIGDKLATDVPMKFRSPDFPGWGHPDYADHLVHLAPGTEVEVTGIESHGSNPWTRYAIRTADGFRTNGVGPAALRSI